MAAARPLRIERTGNRQFDQFQRELATALQPLLSSAFAQGKALRGISLAASVVTPVPHNLGYPLSNWVVLRLVATAPCSIVEIAQAGNLYTTQVTLEASRACVVDIWVS